MDIVLHHDAQRDCADFADLVADSFAAGGNYLALFYCLWDVYRLAARAYPWF
jgi:hypothetical protein